MIALVAISTDISMTRQFFSIYHSVNVALVTLTMALYLTTTKWQDNMGFNAGIFPL